MNAYMPLDELSCCEPAVSHLDREAPWKIETLKPLESFPCGSVLFSEGQSAGSVFVVCGGRVRLKADAGASRLAFPGDVLGLRAALAGGFHQWTAEVVESAQVVEVKRYELLSFLRKHTGICHRLLGLLSEDLHVAYARLREMGRGHALHRQTA